jgi:hypothetical protein
MPHVLRLVSTNSWLARRGTRPAPSSASRWSNRGVDQSSRAQSARFATRRGKQRRDDGGLSPFAGDRPSGSRPSKRVIYEPPTVRITGRHRPDRGTIGKSSADRDYRMSTHVAWMLVIEDCPVQRISCRTQTGRPSSNIRLCTLTAILTSLRSDDFAPRLATRRCHRLWCAGPSRR